MKSCLPHSTDLNLLPDILAQVLCHAYTVIQHDHLKIGGTSPVNNTVLLLYPEVGTYVKLAMSFIVDAIILDHLPMGEWVIQINI